MDEGAGMERGLWTDEWAMNIFEALYNAEINFSLSTFWDGGFDVELGDNMNGVKAETTCRTFPEVEAWLAEHAKKHFPKFRFPVSDGP